MKIQLVIGFVRKQFSINNILEISKQKQKL